MAELKICDICGDVIRGHPIRFICMVMKKIDPFNFFGEEGEEWKTQGEKEVRTLSNVRPLDIEICSNCAIKVPQKMEEIRNEAKNFMKVKK